MKKTIGVLAHVDAGKTTFSEQVLYRAHAIRSMGRVDHRDAFLDSHPLERQRGITIFSDQAVIDYDGDTWYWVDTPGHVDFSPEMERAMSVMDYAVLLLSCSEGIQSHTETVWRMLQAAGVPVFLFLNKTDQEGADQDALISRVKACLTPDALDMRAGLSEDGRMDAALSEELAGRDEELLDRFLQSGYDQAIWLDALRKMIARRCVFPVFSGSALKGVGIDRFMACLKLLTETDWRPDAPFSAEVYKIRHDSAGARQTFVKVLAGRLRVRDELPCGKVGELRLCHGAKYRPVSEAEAGDLCAVYGLSGVAPGDGLGEGAVRRRFAAEPMLMARVEHDASVQRSRVLEKLRLLEDEEPALGVECDSKGISVHVMGTIQLEVLRQIMLDRFGMAIEFGPCRVRYRETIATPAVGVGHYEPLRHYAEVHLLLEPGARGSGITFESRCHVDDLALNWQRLIETHVFEREPRGVLTGSPLTDVHVTLLSGRAHLKHTEGGDFRESTYRAIRNALMYAQSVLLEPICRFCVRVPSESLGALMAQLTRMKAEMEPPVPEEGEFRVDGLARMADLASFSPQLAGMTHGCGRISWRMDHYEPCRDAESAIAEAAYNPLADDTPDSVFCAKGAGFTVVWNKVRDYAHIPVEDN